MSQTSLTRALAPYDSQKTHDQSILPLRPCNIGIFGRKGTGKSNLIKNLIDRKESPYYKHFSKIFLISPTAKKDDKMMEIVDDIGEDQFYEELNNDVLDEIIVKTEEHFNNNKKKKPQYLIIYDDCIHMMKNKNARCMDMIATQNRHHQITNIYLLQKWNNFLPTLVRSNLDCIMIFRSDNKKEVQSFLNEMNGDEDALLKLYQYATSEPYSFLYINMYNTPIRYFKRFDEIKIKK